MSLSVAAHPESLVKIRDLLPGDTGQRTDLLLNLLKTSYTSSLQSAEVRLSALTQEVASLRAQNTYLESKLRSVEALAEAAGKASDEHKKRNDILISENVRFKSENQELRKENEQLNNFKHILMSAANGMAPPASSNGLFSSTLQPQRLGVPDPHLQASASSNTFTTADLGGSMIAPTSNHTNTNTNPSFYFSPLKRPPQESIGVSNMQQTQQQTGQTQPASTPYNKRSSNGYVHVMPSPLTADALASPAPQQHAQKSSSDILNEINANLSSR
jgi:hypothetical protein